MAKVFISYRRVDSSGIARRIYERLTERLDEGSVFIDLRSIPLGANFRHTLEEAISQCDVLLVVIGPQWLNAADKFGRRRLDDESDDLRKEIEKGLELKLRVIPLLVDGASMPQESQLPLALKSLALHQATVIGSGPDFDKDIDSLIRAIEDFTDELFPRSLANSRDRLPVRLLARLSPWLHFKLVKWGWVTPPPEFTIVQNYLSYFEKHMKSLNDVGQYIPMTGAEEPGATSEESEYSARQTRAETMTAIHQTVRMLSGLSGGGDSATADSAGINRQSRIVRNVAKLLRRKAEPVILLGDPGSGKSMTLRKVGLEIARAGLKRVRPVVVVYVRLGQYRETRGGGPADVWPLVEKGVPRQHSNLRDWLRILGTEGRLVILFDGMDEMERLLYGERVSFLSQFAMHYAGTIKTLFACRKNDFNPKFIHRQLILSEFDNDQVRQYLQENIRLRPLIIDGEVYKIGRLANRLLSDNELSETARNPLTLYLLCLFLRSNKALPRTRHELFDNYLLALFDRLRDADNLRLSRELWPATLDGWAQVAYRITSKHAGTSLEISQIRAAGKTPLPDAIIERGLSCGLLVQDETDEQAIRFSHHRLQEYLTARYMDSYATEYAHLDWQSLIDTPRWQEVLISLASIQQERSEALRIVLDSMRSVTSQPDTSDESEASPDNAKRGTAQWRWSATEERVLTERVTLASRVIRELGQNPAKLPPQFLESYTNSLARLAEQGRPTTQVRMLRAWSTASDVCPLSALDTPLNSEIDWVREQALSVVARLSPARTQVDADLRRQLVIDFTNGRLLRRVWAYHKAIIKTGKFAHYADLAWAAVCQLIYAAGIAGIFFAAYYAALELWPMPFVVERALPGMNRTGIALVLPCITLTIATLLNRLWEAELRKRSIYVCAALCSLIFITSRIGTGYNFIWTLFEAALRACLVAGTLAIGTQIIYWFAFGLYMLAGLLRDDAKRRRNDYEVASRNSSFKTDDTLIYVFAGAAGVYAVIWALRSLFELLRNYVLKPVDTYITGTFNIPSWDEYLGYLLLGSVLLLWLISLARRAIPATRRWWDQNRSSASVSLGATFKSLAGLIGNKLLELLSDLPRLIGKLLRSLPRLIGKLLLLGLSLLGLLLGLTFLAFLLFLAFKGLDYIGIDEERRGRLLPLIVMLALTAIPTFGLIVALRYLWLRLGLGIASRLRTRELQGMKVEEWVRRIKAATPEEQLSLLTQTSHRTLGITTGNFLRVLEELESRFLKGIAASQYWKTRSTLEEIARQERLANTAEPDSPAQATRQVKPLMEGSGNFQSSGPLTPSRTSLRKSRSRRIGSLLRWAGMLLLLTIAAGALLNQYLKFQRAIYIVNGLPASVEVQVDGGEKFVMEPDTFQRHNVAEGHHRVAFIREGHEQQEQRFDIASSDIFQRFFDNRTYIVNLGGAAILRLTYWFTYSNNRGGVMPGNMDYFFGYGFGEFSNIDHLFEMASPRNSEEFQQRELRFSPDMPAWVFLRLPSAYSDTEKLDLAEKHLRYSPSNTSLLVAYKDYAVGRGYTKRCHDFLLSQMGEDSLFFEWYSLWQELAFRLQGPASQAQVEEKLKAIVKNESLLLCLNAEIQPSLKKALEAYDNAIRIDPQNLYAWFGKCLALENQGNFEEARAACLESYRLYRTIIEALFDPSSYILSIVLNRRSQMESFYWYASLKLLDLNFALRDYPEAEAHLESLRKDWNYKYALHEWALALDMLKGEPGSAQERHAEYSVAIPTRKALSATILHYLREEFDEQLRASKEIPEPYQSNYYQAYAHLELGNYEQAKSHYASPYGEARGVFSLMAVVGSEIKKEKPPNEQRLQVAEDIRSSGLPVYLTIADLLSSSSVPEFQTLADLNLSPDEKSILLVAIAQRFPELRQDGQALADRLAYTPFPPGRFLRKAILSLK